MNAITFSEDLSRVTLSPVHPVPGGVLPAIPSKSHAHRLLIAAALSDRAVFLGCPATSRDIDATAACLCAMGAKIERNDAGFRVIPISRSSREADKTDGLLQSDSLNSDSPANCLNGDHPPILRMSVGESGSTLRFLLPVLGALGLSAELELEGRLPERPLFPLDREMKRHGVTLSEQGSNPLRISGRLTPGDYIIDGGISSQYITGLLLALPLLNGDSRIRIAGRLASRPYVDITLQVLREFGIRIRETGPETEENKEITTIFHISGNQQYHSETDSCTVEADWSNAAFFLTAGALLSTPVTVTGCRPESPQGDRRILSLLREFGAKITVNPQEQEASAGSTASGLSDIRVQGGSLHGIEIDAADIPDLVPILSVAAAFAEGTTIIRNIDRLRIKESDRVATVMEMISGIGGTIEEVRENSSSFLRITGNRTLPGGTVSSHNDHRIAMAAAIASLRTSAPVTILTPMAIEKSYPGFYRDLSKILGE